MPRMTAKKAKKNAQMVRYGQQGPRAMRKRMGEAAYREHMRKLGKRSQKLRRQREQEAA